jgi:aryl carrier-like protein
MYPRVPANGKPSNIGPQFDNVGTYVFAPGTEKPVLRGALGELCAAGKLVGRGYLNRPQLTKERFPFLEKYREKIYRTGDLVRILHNNTFDFSGRTDDQVKLRGQRLEIGEINEVVKKANQSVAAVATLVLGHPKQQKDQLVSFIVLDAEHLGAQSKPEVRCDGNHSSIIPELIAACKSKLPGYMVPTHFLPLSHMPLSVNNKVDNKILKAVYHETTLEVLQLLAKQEEDDGQWNDVEKRVRSILADMTKLEEIDIKRLSTVFELGLDSVSVVGLARRLNKNGYGIATPSLIMQHPTLVQLAAELTEGAADGGADIEAVEATRKLITVFANQSLPTVCDRLQLDIDGIERILPCTSLQEGMIARFLDSDKPLYFNSFPMTLGASTDVVNLKKAWGNVVQSTDVLKTCFCETPDGYAQIVLQHAPLRWDEVEIDKEDFGSEVERGLLRSVSENRYLHSPPISILGIKTPTKYVLVLYIFHALYDGNSLPLILSDVRSAYDGSYRPRQCQFGDVIGHLLSTDLKEGQKFWVENVQPGKPLPLEQLHAPSGEQVFGDYGVGLKLEFNIGDLEALCQRIQCTPQPVFQAAWVSVLATYVGSVVTFGLIVSGRSLPLDDIEEVIGPTFNTIPCTFAVKESSSWETLIKAIHKFNSQSIPFHHTPLRRIRKWLYRNTEPFDTLFGYQRHGSSEVEDQTLWELSSGTITADVSALSKYLVTELTG